MLVTKAAYGVKADEGHEEADVHEGERGARKVAALREDALCLVERRKQLMERLLVRALLLREAAAVHPAAVNCTLCQWPAPHSLSNVP